ncbi:unnamed protein product, partial [Didymodactylos carnosus]
YDPDAGSLSSPASTHVQYVQSAAYTVQFQCEIDKQRDQIANITCLSHPISIDYAGDSIKVSFSQQNVHLDRDIILDLILTENPTSCMALAIESHALMTSFIPNKTDFGTQQDVNNEFIFIVDCSGSMMDENKMGLAREAMELFLKSLPMKCRFNLVRFGTTYHALFNDVTVVYDELNASKAQQLISKMRADLGGTELLAPLKWIFEQKPFENYSRQIFVLTDGEISNVDQVMDLCKQMANTTRIFSFGLEPCPKNAFRLGPLHQQYKPLTFDKK